jgi:hypothetical protein
MKKCITVSLGFLRTANDCFVLLNSSLLLANSLRHLHLKSEEMHNSTAATSVIIDVKHVCIDSPNKNSA